MDAPHAAPAAAPARRARCRAGPGDTLARACSGASSRASSVSTASPSAPTMWQRPQGGGGISRLDRGRRRVRARRRGLLARQGREACRARPPRTAPELAGRPARPWACPCVLHPRNPYVPTVHMNVRCFHRLPAPASGADEPVWWFGGGMDLTPYYGFEEDAATSTAPAEARSSPSAPQLLPGVQDVVRRVLLPEAPQRAARHRRHVLRRLQRARLRAQRSRCQRSVGDAFLAGLRADRRAAPRRCPTASASASSSAIGAAATSNSTWCSTAARCSACRSAAAPSPS
jgi:hypothetical protein